MADAVRGGARALPVARRSSGWATTSWPAPQLGPARAGSSSPATSTPSRRSAGTTSPGSRTTTLYGVGAADMKGGLAVFLHLAGRLPEPAVDVTWCFYAGRGGGAASTTGCASCGTSGPTSLAADAAILGEPTGGRRRGRLPGHAPGPDHGWPVAGPTPPAPCRAQRHPPPGPAADGRGRLRGPSAGRSTAASTPSSSRRSRSRAGWRATWCPTRRRSCSTTASRPTATPRQAESALRELLAPLPRAGGPLGARRRRAPAPHPRSTTRCWPPWWRPRRRRPGPRWDGPTWRRFWAHGVPATNFGPADPLLAHTPGEHVSEQELVDAAAVLEALLRRRVADVTPAGPRPGATAAGGSAVGSAP